MLIEQTLPVQFYMKHCYYYCMEMQTFEEKSFNLFIPLI